jgi:hypothetical protein
MAKLRINGASITIEGCGGCSTCQTIKAEKDFYKDSSRKSGIGTRCKSCETSRTYSRAQKRSLMTELKDLAETYPVYRTILASTSERLAA